MHRPETEKGAAPLAAPSYGAAGTDGIWTEGDPVTATPATDLDEEFFNDVTENLFELLSQGGVTPTKGRKEDLVDAVKALIGSNLKGLVIGNFEYVSATVVRLARGLEGKVFIEIDGQLRSQASDLDFDITTDLEAGQSEAASTWYYAYIRDNGGTLEAHISATPPESNPASKLGYHPGTGSGSTTWRYVGAFFNDASSNVMPFHCSGQGGIGINAAIGQYTYDDGPTLGTFHFSPGTTGGAAPRAYASVALTNACPESAREVLCLVSIQAAGTMNKAHYTDNGGLPKTTDDEMGQFALNKGTNSINTAVNQFWIKLDDPSTPGVAWAIEAATGAHELWVVGWR